MTPLRVSATAVEAWRLFMAPENDWMSVTDLEAQILGRAPASPAMALGTAFGALIEHDGVVNAEGRYVSRGIAFDGASMRDVLARYDRRGLFEVKGTKAYGDVLVVSKADQMLGAQLIETKTTLHGFDFEKYAASLQWRLMADMFAPAVVTYRVALLAEPEPCVFAVKELVQFDLFPYADLHRDCCAAVAGFREFVVARGLDQALRERQALVEAA
jgi:hypothetical protein